MNEKTTVPPARPASTVLILRDNPFEVLMVKRHAKAVFASALVFPGGMVEAADFSADWLPYVEGAAGLDEEERAYRIAACREAFEEAAILLTSTESHISMPQAGEPPPDFLQMVRQSGAKLMLDKLYPFAHWITPEVAPKRFDTRFYVCLAPANHEAVCDGMETVSLEWITPQAALASAEAGGRIIEFPTRMNLKRLTESANPAAAIEAAKARPHFTTLPLLEQTEKGPYVHIPIEAGYGVTGGFR